MKGLLQQTQRLLVMHRLPNQCCDTEVKLPFCEEEVMKLNLVIPSYPSEPREQGVPIVQHYA